MYFFNKEKFNWILQEENIVLFVQFLFKGQFLKWGSVEKFWINNILPVVDSSLKDRSDELMAS